MMMFDWGVFFVLCVDSMCVRILCVVLCVCEV